MRKYWLTFLIGICHFCLLAQSWSVGSGVIYGDDIDKLGMHFRAYYNFANDRVCFGPEYSYFFKSSASSNGRSVTRSLSEINFNIHYIFEISHKWGIYPLTGVNFSFEKEEIEVGGIMEIEETTKWGANLGFGVHRTVGNWMIFGEFDHLFSDLTQNSFIVGAFITFGKNKLEKNE